MKNIRFVSLLVAALVMGSVAQAQQTHVRSSVPFRFQIGDKMYEAGDYTIQQLGNSAAALRIELTGGPNLAMVLSNTCSSSKPVDETKLVFHRVGNTYFLSRIWTAGYSQGREFRVSKTEIQMASNQGKTDEVIVAANVVH